MKRNQTIERMVLYRVVRDMYVGLSNVIPINIGLMFVLLAAVMYYLGLYITGTLMIVNPLFAYHCYNTFKRV